MSRDRYILVAFGILLAVGSFCSCGKDGNDWTDTAEWRDANMVYYCQCVDSVDNSGNKFYSPVKPDWYPTSGVLMHMFTNPEETIDNLQPMSTSKVEVKYTGQLYNGLVFDQTTVDADSTRIIDLSSVIEGWKIALTQMHVGDSCQIIIPYAQGYGFRLTNGIPAYSTLKFDIRLVSVPAFEIP